MYFSGSADWVESHNYDRSEKGFHVTSNWRIDIKEDCYTTGSHEVMVFLTRCEHQVLVSSILRELIGYSKLTSNEYEYSVT